MSKAKKKEPAPTQTAVAPGPPTPQLTPKRIRMKMTLGTPKRCFTAGLVLEVGNDVPEETALSWLRSGAAEEDKSLPGPPEIK